MVDIKQEKIIDPHVAVIDIEDKKIRFTAVTDNIIRVTVTGKDSFDEISSLGIETGKNEGDGFTALEEDVDIKFYTDKVSVSVYKKNGTISFSRLSDGMVLTRVTGHELVKTPVVYYTTGDEKPIIKRVKTVDGERNFVENMKPVTDHEAYRAKIRFRFKDSDIIHGFGQAEEGIFNYRGHVQYLYQHNMRIPIPFMISERNYGILVDCGCLMTFNDDERGSYIYLKNTEQLDYYVISGENADEIIAGYRYLTGKASMLPKWSFGYVQSKEKYTSQDELVSIAKKYRDLGVGLDCVVQDWKTWEGDEWGCKKVDRSRYPDLKKMTKVLKELHVHSMVSIWPNMNSGTVDYEEMTDKGFMLNDLATYDAFNEKARELYWTQCERDLFSGGFDSWWCDSTEPFSGPDWGGEKIREPWERFELVGKEHEKFLGQQRANLYAVSHAKGIYENQRKSKPDKRVLNLTRSGYPSIQKYGTMLWSGDIAASYDTLKTQITEGLNMAASGMPYWTLDIGAFFVVNKNWQKRGCDCNNDPTPKWFWHGNYEDGLEDNAYRELYVRWLEMGVFLPMFRSHGTDVPREIWNFGEKGTPFYDAIEAAIALRYTLIPYIYSLAGLVRVKDYTMMRPLFFDFADDAKACAIHDEYMFGPAFLVCPVTEPMYYDIGNVELEGVDTVRECYLPEGCDWYDCYTGKKYKGGSEVRVDTPLSHIGVFVREGSIIPMEHKLTYAEEVVDTPLEIHIYPGCDSEFYYYEDGGDDYGYEDGKYNLIHMEWKDEEKLLKIGGCDLKFDGGIKGRELKVILGGKAVQAVYEGKDIDIRLE
ncbi:MAG: glycoside hydrolase family 31 protein [Lachnospiraceae bacterium]|nr:glycoside hydrolase family 31 protein [Lachnospiraceae bacterium]